MSYDHFSLSLLSCTENCWPTCSFAIFGLWQQCWESCYLSCPVWCRRCGSDCQGSLNRPGLVLPGLNVSGFQLKHNDPLAARWSPWLHHGKVFNEWNFPTLFPKYGAIFLLAVTLISYLLAIDGLQVITHSVHPALVYVSLHWFNEVYFNSFRFALHSLL